MSDLKTLVNDEPKLRVLFVPDSTYWITGRISRQIARYNPWIEPTICSFAAVRKLLQDHGGKFPGEIDLVHFLTYSIATELIGSFRDRAACVTTIHHFEDERCIEAEPLADAVMTVCKQWHNYLISIGVESRKLVMVPNGVQAELFRPPTSEERKKLRLKSGLPLDSFIIGFSAKRTSNSYNRKGIETVAAAMGELKRRIPNVALVIIGPGWRDFVSQQIERGINCLYLPFVVDHEDLAPIYRILDVYWVTARIEGGPVPLLEAMSSGVACITTPVGVALEVVTNCKNGIFANFGDADALVRETEQLAANPEMRRKIGEAARQSILNDYQCAETSKSAQQLYKTAIATFHRRRPTTPIRNIPDNPDRFEGQGNSSETLASIPMSLRSWVAAEEHLIFMHELILMDADEAAYKLSMRALRHRPSDLRIWRSMAAVSPVGPVYKAFGKGYRRSKSLAKRLLRIGV